MAKVVPVGYILTDEAIKELVTADAKWRQLNDEWQRATGEAKQLAYRAACEIQDQITEALFAAAKAREVPAIALKRTARGDWIEHILANEYLESFGGDMALWTGSVERLGLDPPDQWISDAPLCFRRVDFDRWTAKRVPQPERPLGSGETYWTAIQAIEWIATRDRLAVASAKSDLRQDALYDDDLHEDVTLAFHEVLENETYKVPLVWRRDAVGLLVEACRTGDIMGIGLEQGSGESVEILVSAWAHRTIADSRHGVACVSIDRSNHEATWWNQLLFLRGRIEARWPIPEAEIGDRRTHLQPFKPHEIPPDHPPMSLLRFTGCVSPRWCQVWLLAQDCVHLVREAERIRVKVAKRFPRIPAWNSIPHELRGKEVRRRQIEARAQRILLFKLAPALVGAIASGEWTVRARDPIGTEAVVPSRLASQLVFDPAANSISLADGSTVWRGVTVEHASPAVESVQALPQDQLATAMLGDREIIALVKPVIEGIASDGLQLRRLDFEPMLRELCGSRLPPKAAERLWPMLALERWRKGGKRPAGKLVDDWRPYAERASKAR
jgi:hypothetical protein